ncbi:hypothetical protein MRX96_045507 [Rhipicephalus microplus]
MCLVSTLPLVQEAYMTCSLLRHTSVHTEQVSEIEYDTYEEEETTTRKALPPSRRTRKPQRNQVYSIEKFLNTCDPIWVYNSTEKANITCRVDVMEDVNFFYANITRYTLSNGEVNAVSAKAQFSYHPNLATTSDDYNEMKLEIPGKCTFLSLLKRYLLCVLVDTF